MRVGITLPQFRQDAGPALELARRAEALGIDGVFVFDHLWAIGNPEGPALSAFPLLGALGATLERAAIGTLVARVGMVPDAMLVNQFQTLERIVGRDRLIAGIGTGDRISAEENLAFGLEYPSADERRAAVARVGAMLSERGIEVWVGDGAAPTRKVAVDGGHVLNLWQRPVEGVAEAASTGVAVSWGGEVDRAEPEAHMRRLREAGATWAVASFSPDVEKLAEAAAALR